MDSLHYYPATEADLSFIREVYEENMDALHGNHRTLETWKDLMKAETSAYYIVKAAEPVAWFRLDTEEDLELGMLQVKPACHRQGVGKYVLSVTEELAKKSGYSKVIIHTTEDNLPAQALYRKAGYALTEVGPCTTADGAQRVGYTFEKHLTKTPAKPVAVRPYQEEDYEAVSRIHDAARKIELVLANLSDAFLPFSVASEREDFFDYPHIDVATIAERVVGFCAYTEEELAWLYVSTDLFRQKIGSTLIENALKTEPGICEIEVLYGNEPAKRLYETFGFTLKKLVNGVMPGNEAFPVTVYCLHKEKYPMERYEITEKDRALIAAGLEVLCKNFDDGIYHHTVGCALLCKNGKVYTGVNCDGIHGSCAEYITMGIATSAGERDFDTIVATHEKAPNGVVSPCGNCRQMLFEYCPDIKVIVNDEKGNLIKVKARDLLPFAWEPVQFE